VFRPDHGIWFGFYALHLVVFIPFVTAVRALHEINGAGVVWLQDWQRLRVLLPISLKRLFTGTAVFAVMVIGYEIYQDLILKSHESGFQGTKSMSAEWKTWITPVSPDGFVSFGAFWAVFFLISACLLTMRKNWTGPESPRRRS
jgi:hypothetical protein